MWSDATNEFITTCLLMIGVATQFLGVAPALVDGGVEVLGAWLTCLLELVEPSVAYPFDTIIRKSFDVGEYVDYRPIIQMN